MHLARFGGFAKELDLVARLADSPGQVRQIIGWFEGLRERLVRISRSLGHIHGREGHFLALQLFHLGLALGRGLLQGLTLLAGIRQFFQTTGQQGPGLDQLAFLLTDAIDERIAGRLPGGDRRYLADRRHKGDLECFAFVGARPRPGHEYKTQDDTHHIGDNVKKRIKAEQFCLGGLPAPLVHRPASSLKILLGQRLAQILDIVDRLLLTGHAPERNRWIHPVVGAHAVRPDQETHLHQ